MITQKLEDNTLFAPVAWTICICFALYVGFLAVNLAKEIQNINLQQNTTLR